MFVFAIIILLCLVSSSLYYFQEKLIFFPEKLPGDFQFSFPYEFVELTYEVEPGIIVNALHFKASNPKGVIFYSHGNAGSLRHWGFVADAFLKHDFDLLIYDYRSYGKSNGSISEDKLYNDALHIYTQLLDHYSEDQIIVYGRSIGTAIATKVALVNNPKHLVLESPYYNFSDLVKNIFPFVPSFLVRYQLRNDLMIGQVKCPVTLFHGEKDEVIYYESSAKLKNLLKETDQLVPVPGGHHNDLDEFEVYQNAIEALLR